MEATDQIFNKQCETTDGVAELHKDDGQCYWDEVGGVGGGGWCGVGGGGWCGGGSRCNEINIKLYWPL